MENQAIRGKAINTLRPRDDSCWNCQTGSLIMINMLKNLVEKVVCMYEQMRNFREM